jgi:hypothetical protein
VGDRAGLAAAELHRILAACDCCNCRRFADCRLCRARRRGPHGNCDMVARDCRSCFIAAVIAFLSIGFGLVEEPTSHAYDATVSFISVYAAFHSGLAAILALYLILRALSGYISQARNLELRVFRMWCGFTAAINLILAFFLFVFPPWVAP